MGPRNSQEKKSHPRAVFAADHAAPGKKELDNTCFAGVELVIDL
jgi:hypothetical protein